MEKLRQIVGDISVAMATASQLPQQQGDSTLETRSCEYDNVTSVSTGSSQKTSASNLSADSDVLASGRYVSNTSVSLTPAGPPPAVPGAPTHTRTSMREMQDSNSYVSFTSAKELPICAPATAVRQRPPTPAADVEKEWKQIVYAAETVVEGGASVDELSDASLERLVAGVDSTSTSDRQQMIMSVSGSDAQSLPQPLSFANPLFLYRTSARPSPSSSMSSLDSSLIQKSYSLSSVVGSDDAGSRHASATVNHGDSAGRSDLTERRAGGAVAPGWKPSRGNECFADGAGDSMHHSAILSAIALTAKPLGVGANLSQSTELSVSCDTEQSKHGATVSKIVGLETPPDSPHCVGGCHGVGAGRKAAPSQNNVRMGVRSMHRRPVEPEKSKMEVTTVTYITFLCLIFTLPSLFIILCLTGLFLVDVMN